MTARRLHLSQMTAEQQAAYWKDKARRWEARAKDLFWAADGRTPEELEDDLDELDQLRRERATASPDERNHS